jgi:hypothetical protein
MADLPEWPKVVEEGGAAHHHWTCSPHLMDGNRRPSMLFWRANRLQARQGRATPPPDEDTVRNTFEIIVLTGRPAAGKSEVIDCLKTR